MEGPIIKNTNQYIEYKDRIIIRKDDPEESYDGGICFVICIILLFLLLFFWLIILTGLYIFIYMLFATILINTLIYYQLDRRIKHKLIAYSGPVVIVFIAIIIGIVFFPTILILGFISSQLLYGAVIFLFLIVINVFSTMAFSVFLNRNRIIECEINKNSQKIIFTQRCVKVTIIQKRDFHKKTTKSKVIRKVSDDFNKIISFNLTFLRKVDMEVYAYRTMKIYVVYIIIDDGVKRRKKIVIYSNSSKSDSEKVKSQIINFLKN